MSDWNDIDNPYNEILNDLPWGIRNSIPNLNISHIKTDTEITNFRSIISNLKRDIIHLKKYISKELGVKTIIKGNSLIIKSKFTKEKLTNIIDSYIQIYVICKLCVKPDTLLHVKKKKYFIECASCGNTYQI